MSERSVPVTVARALLLSTVIVPLIMAANLFFPYIVPRTVFFRTVVEVTLGIFIYLLIARDWRIRTHVDLFFWGLFAFVSASALSALFSPAQNRSIFGDFERMGGVWALIHYLIFYALLRVFFREKEWKLYANLGLVVSAIVSLLALAQDNGRFPPVSTVGNSGLLGLYLFFGVCLSVYLAFKAAKTQFKLVYAASAALCLSGIVVSQNRSSILGLAVAAAVATAVFFFLGKAHRKVISVAGTALVVLFGLGLTLIARAPESWLTKRIPATFSRIAASGLETDANRTVLWTAALDGFRDRPLVGYGPENFHLAWSANFQPKVYTVTSEQRVDRAHNIMLEVLSTTGIVGFLSFLAMWAALFYSISAGLRQKTLTLPEASFFAALSAGYLIALGFWFLDINSFIFWVAICAYLGSRLAGHEVMEFDVNRGMDLRNKLVLGAGLAAIGASLWLHSFETVRVSRLLYRTQTAQSDMPTTMHAFFGVFDSPAPQSTHTPYLFGRYMGWLVPRLVPAKMDAASRSLVDTAFARGITEMERERKRDPRNELIYLQQSRLALLASSYYGLPTYYEFALKTLRDAEKLSPRRVQPKLVLAYTLMIGKRFDEAEPKLMEARAIYPTSGQIYYYIGELHRLRNNLPAAAAALDTSLTLGFSGQPDVYLALLKSLTATGSYAPAASLAENYLRVVLSGYNPSRPRRNLIASSPEAVPLLAGLPWLWAKAGDHARALQAAENLKAIYPPATAKADAFIRALAAGNEAGWQQDTSLLQAPRN